MLARPVYSSLAAIAFLMASGIAAEADTLHPTVVEIFQSQGCSSCPPANANVLALSRQPDILTLSFGVTYWDQLGWKDTFASPRYTERQWDYARAFHRSNVFTPEVVVNGRADVVGQNLSELEALIRKQSRIGNAPNLRIENGFAQVGAGQGKAEIWLVRYDPRVVQVPIARGENSGITLPHKNVVKELTKLGEWSGEPQGYRLPPETRADWREAVLVQQGPGGPILAAVRN